MAAPFGRYSNLYLQRIWWQIDPIRAVVALTFFLRIAAMALAALRINPYSTHDSRAFTVSAAHIGTTLFTGPVVAGPLFPSLTSVQIFRFWGLLLAPFWALPGPSWIYAHIGMAVLGALAVWNVAVIGRHWHSPAVGVIAALPIAIFPSFVLVHATLLRDVAVLAGLTTTTRMAVIPSKRLGRTSRFVIAVVVLGLTTPLRLENAPLYAVTVVIGAASWGHCHRILGRREKIAYGGIFALGAAVAVVLAPRVVDYFSRLRGYRTSGQSVYLPTIIPETVLGAIAFAPIGALYFLFSPFPWMVHRPSQLVVFIETIGNLGFAIAGFAGGRYLLSHRRSQVSSRALFVGFVLAALLYGLVEGNVGTAVRHRQMFMWVLYLFGAVGIVEWLTSRRAQRSQ